MRSLNEFGLRGNPFTKTPLILHWEGQGINPPPPETKVRITDIGDVRIADDNNIRITD